MTSPALFVLSLFTVAPRPACRDGRKFLPSAKLPAATYRRVHVWESASIRWHQTGRAVDDPTASGGKHWEARPGDAAPNRALQYGPYAEEPAGNYLALFRLRLSQPVENDQVARLDAATHNGQGVLALRGVLAPSDLRADRSTRMPLLFHHPGGKLEVRVLWSGYAGLKLNQFQLFAIEGPVDPSASRDLQPRSVGRPDGLPYAPPPDFEHLFPRPPHPAPRLTVVDLMHRPSDEVYALLCLQGLVNRQRPSLYVILSETDRQWLDWLLSRGWIDGTEVVSEPLRLVDRYREQVKGLVIHDFRLPATRNLATMLAAVKDGLVASPRLAKRLGLPVLDDLRGRFKTSVEAYRWAFDTLWPQLSHQVVACLWPDSIGGLRDYLVEQKVFIFWLSGPLDGTGPGADPNAELALMEELLAKMPANIPVLGYPYAGRDVGIGEHDGVQSFARYGKYLVGSVACANLSLHSGFPRPELKQPRPSAPPLENKVYVTWVMSDGDNLPVLQCGNSPQLWAQKERGQVPVAWSISPSAAVLMPAVVDWYFRTATPNDTFVGAVSGIGYTYPDDYAAHFKPAARVRLFDDFLHLTADGMAASGLDSIWIMGIRNPELIRRYVEQIPALQAVFPDYGRRVPAV